MATKASAKKPVKKTTSSKTPVKSTVVSKSTSRKYITKRNIIVLVVAILVALGLLAYAFKGLFIAATVNGTPITRMQLVSELEKKTGKQTLEGLVTKELILQEMQKKNITVSDTDVNTEMKKIEDALTKQGRTLDDALTQQGLTKTDLIDQLRIQKMIERLFANDTTVSEKEIDAYIEQNKATLPTEGDEKSIRASVKEQIRQQKLTAKFQAWLSNLQKEAKIQYFVSF